MSQRNPTSVGGLPDLSRFDPGIPRLYRLKQLLRQVWPLGVWRGAIAAAIALWRTGVTRGDVLAIVDDTRIRVARTVEARVRALRVEPGDEVAEGQVLAVLDPEELRSRLDVEQVRGHLRYARALLRAIVREHLAESLEHPADLDPEYEHLFGAGEPEGGRR